MEDAIVALDSAAYILNRVAEEESCSIIDTVKINYQAILVLDPFMTVLVRR